VAAFAGRRRVAGSAAVPFFATAAKGTEPALRDELRELRFRNVRADRGGVHFEGDPSEGYRACLWSRIAVRVLEPRASFEAPGERALYDHVRALDLGDAIDAKRTLVVSAACRSSRLTHTQYLSQLTKDAIVDRIRDKSGARPNVDKRDADVHVFVHLVKDVATVYLDLAGEPLHRRGYREPGGEAPLKETLAAAIVRLSHWDRKSELADPMCGSGTLLLEAALWARNVAPGLLRPRFGFERFCRFDESQAARWRELREQAAAAQLPHGPPVFGSDTDRDALDRAARAAERAGIDVSLLWQELRDYPTKSSPGTFVSNPPYGHRLERGANLSRELATLVDRHPSASVALLMAADQPMGHTRRRPEPLHRLWNGDIECVVRRYAAGE
jgi:23S rRNA G2445 N2-methylase RlmL